MREQNAFNAESHPAWVCGLKRLKKKMILLNLVTPCVGVWIETFITNKYTGARIGHTLRGCVD